YSPELYRDNSPTQPRSENRTHKPYHLTSDLTDEAISQIRELRGSSPHKPYFMYYAPGACHAPHQAPTEFIEKYRGRFDHGWDEERRRAFERQKSLGILPTCFELPPSNPCVRPWASLDAMQM